MAKRTAGSPAAPNDSGSKYPTKYWWVVLVVVPLAVAVFQYPPWKTASIAHTTLGQVQVIGRPLVS